MYQVLYRKYRPRVFADVYGQDHVTSTLKNEIKEGRISHAYLFTGSRGTGKTSCAKILAKAVNCENSIDGEPCNTCEICKGLDAGIIYDVVEIDAASNNGVDNIRDLREEVNYTPTRGKYRVYIIDEVHMLSTGAFNALLKTLEEPPEHVIFILATTEVHKLPATILSRCQRFDFKHIQPETMAVRLKEVAKKEGLSLTDDSAILIARIADGALRDGLSILDQCAGRSREITVDLVSEVAGLAGREALYNLSDAVANNDSSRALSIISQLYENSYDMERLCVEMINHYRNFLIVKTVKKNRGLIVSTDDEYNTIVGSAERFTIENVIHALELFQNTLTVIKGGGFSRIEMEMAFVRLCEPKLSEGMDAVLDRLSSLERAVKNGAIATICEPPAQSIEETKQEEKITETRPPAEKEISEAPRDAEMPKTEEDDSSQRMFEQWDEFMDIIHKTDIALFGVLSGSRGFVRGSFFLVDSPNPTIKEFMKISTHSKAIKNALFEITGVQYKLGLFKTKSDAPKQQDPLDALLEQAQGKIDVNLI